MRGSVIPIAGPAPRHWPVTAYIRPKLLIQVIGLCDRRVKPRVLLEDMLSGLGTHQVVLVVAHGEEEQNVRVLLQPKADTSPLSAATSRCMDLFCWSGYLASLLGLMRSAPDDTSKYICFAGSQNDWSETMAEGVIDMHTSEDVLSVVDRSGAEEKKLALVILGPSFSTSGIGQFAA
ncbi:hypothetical protein FVE85_6140 [Porphyridium purpureum]|uniref:Uncharacterized protein n=1 Tax=Porphyridium purpureum TaxID=35688 RepID=A0A5J4Z5F5_PORPP|nr:hypothetical protein FVE85_6140 [Porphyridium purpureum]|eukprot:POR4035..scf295_1